MLTQAIINLLAAESTASEDEISRVKMTKKFASEDHSPFYLTGASVDMPDDGMEDDTFQVIATRNFKLTTLSTINI